MKKNGFTFVELLAMLVVLGIIMVVAIPNITGMLKNQKINVFKNDAKSMVETAKIKISKDNLIVKPVEGDCIVFALNYLNVGDNIITGPNGGLYDQFDSFVVYTRSGNKYKYYVRLVELYKSKRIGVALLDSNSITDIKSSSLTTLTTSSGLVKTDNRAAGINKLKSFSVVRSKCTNIKGYYSGGHYCVRFNNQYYDDEGNIVSYSKYTQSCS